jgi:hypothetical protein
MPRHRWFCALLFVLAAVRSACADVGYSYVADQANYTGVAGSIVTVKLYLVETVTQSGTNQTSLINRYFANSDFSVTYNGLSSVGIGVEQTGLSGGGVTSQILGPSIFTPTAGYNGVSNNAGFAFGPDFTYNFTQKVNGTNVPMTGGSKASVLYQNLNDPATNFNGNNIQVKAALVSGNSINNENSQNGVLTDAQYNQPGDSFGTGKILIGTLSIAVGQGTTTFQVKPLAQTALTATPTTSFNTITLNGALGSTAGTVTTLSGATGQTTLTVPAFGGPVDLDQNYLSATRPTSAAFNSFNTAASGVAVSGPSLSPATSSSLPFYTGTSEAGVFTFSVASVPEPSSIVLCGFLAAVGAVRAWRRRVA